MLWGKLSEEGYFRQKQFLQNNHLGNYTQNYWNFSSPLALSFCMQIA